MKNIIYLFIYFIVFNIYSQEKKEEIYLFFNNSNNKKCKIEVEYSHDNDSKLDGYTMVKEYRKEFKKNRTIFHICDEKFFFNPIEQKKDTCSIRSLKKLNIKTLDYIKEKYYKGNDFKHHTFKQINIVEKISETKIVKYFNVHWCCEWTIED